PGRVGEGGEQLQPVEVVRITLERRAVERLGLNKVACPMGRESASNQFVGRQGVHLIEAPEIRPQRENAIPCLSQKKLRSCAAGKRTRFPSGIVMRIWLTRR